MNIICSRGEWALTSERLWRHPCETCGEPFKLHQNVIGLGSKSPYGMTFRCYHSGCRTPDWGGFDISFSFTINEEVPDAVRR